MSLINALTPLLTAKTTKVALDISAHPSKGDHLVVVAKPVTGPVPSNASEELKFIIAGLATGIKVVAKAEDVEAELVAHITEQAPQRSQWAQRAEQITSAADEAAKKSTAKKAASGKPAEKVTEAATKVEAVTDDTPQTNAESSETKGDGFELEL